MIERRRWAAGWNIPGCLPCGDVVAFFDTAEEAWEWVNGERAWAAEQIDGGDDPYVYWVESRDESEVSCTACGAGRYDDCYDDCSLSGDGQPLSDRLWIVMVEGDFAVYGPFNNATEAVYWAMGNERATTIRSLTTPSREGGSGD